MVSVHYQDGAFVPRTYGGSPRWHKEPRPDPRVRKQVKFWVDVEKDIGGWVIEVMGKLKEQRLFKQTMLEGFRLVIELRNKKIDYLFELFPWIEAWMDSEINREVERQVTRRMAELKPAPAPDTSALEARLAKLEAMLEQGSAPVGGPKPLNGGPKPLTQATPDDDDDTPLLTMRKAQSDGKTAAKNFLDSAFGLIG